MVTTMTCCRVEPPGPVAVTVTVATPLSPCSLAAITSVVPFSVAVVSVGAFEVARQVQASPVAPNRGGRSIRMESPRADSSAVAGVGVPLAGSEGGPSSSPFLVATTRTAYSVPARSPEMVWLVVFRRR